MYDLTTLEAALQSLGELLADRDESHTVVAIGGGALALLGLIPRATEDIDLVAIVEDEQILSAEPLPPPLADAIVDVARLRGLSTKWMNAEPTGLLHHGLPEGCIERCQTRVFGSLTLLLASRFDQVHFKLLAISRPGDKHHADLRRLQPTRDELLSAARWARTQATGEGFELELAAALASFGVDVADV